MDIESGEPFYDGANDKTLMNIDIYHGDGFYHADENSFIVVADEIIYLISHDLEVFHYDSLEMYDVYDELDEAII